MANGYDVAALSEIYKSVVHCYSYRGCSLLILSGKSRRGIFKSKQIFASSLFTAAIIIKEMRLTGIALVSILGYNCNVTQAPVWRTHPLTRSSHNTNDIFSRNIPNTTVNGTRLRTHELQSLVGGVLSLLLLQNRLIREQIIISRASSAIYRNSRVIRTLWFKAPFREIQGFAIDEILYTHIERILEIFSNNY